MSLLVVFGGLPGTGKTSVAREVADRLGATFVRLDSVEVAMRRAGFAIENDPVGYAVGHAIVADQLSAGRAVVVDAVNPVQSARDGWRSLAAHHGAELHFVRVVLGDNAVHRQRVESRCADLAGHRLPTWAEVSAAQHDPWSDEHLELDNSSSLSGAVATVLESLEPRSADQRVARGMRELVVADAGEVLTLQLAAWVREAHANDTLDIPPLHEQLSDVQAGLVDPGLRTWGLHEQGRLIAMVRLSALDARTAFVGRLGVVPDLRGIGLGGATLRFAEAQVPVGTQRVELITGLRSTDNQAFYAHHGYDLIERDPEIGIVRLAKTLG